MAKNGEKMTKLMEECKLIAGNAEAAKEFGKYKKNVLKYTNDESVGTVFHDSEGTVYGVKKNTGKSITWFGAVPIRVRSLCKQAVKVS